MKPYIEYLKKNYHGRSRLCLHNIVGHTTAPKICILNYECSHCAFDQWLDNLERAEINREKGVLRDVLLKGSRKNKFTILSVEAPGWQGAKAQEYQAYSELSQRSQAGCIGA